MHRTNTIGWIVLVVAISFAILMALFTGDWGGLITVVLSVLVGSLVGTFLMLGAFRLFSWGESAARSIVVGLQLVGVALIVLLLFVVGDLDSEPQPHPATISYYSALGFLMGAIARARTINKQLSTEARP
jgi:hypothetical protein